MGKIYKLKPEIINFVLEQKKANPVLSCRRLASLTADRFQIRFSKSSVNSLIKDAGLSMPVGRRQKRKKKQKDLPQRLLGALQEASTAIALSPMLITQQLSAKPSSPLPEPPLLDLPPLAPVPVIPVAPAPLPPAPVSAPLPIQPFPVLPLNEATLMRTMDYLVEGSSQMNIIIKDRLSLKSVDGLMAKTEAVIFKPFFPQPVSMVLSSYLDELQSVKTMGLDIIKIISGVFQEVRCVKVSLTDGEAFYLDGQLRTVWSTPHIPYDFSTTIYSIRSYINKYFYGNTPFLLFSAPGYDIPTKEFFKLLLSLDATEKRISRLTLYDYQFEEMYSMPIDQSKKKFFIFGMWPWQFAEYRQVKKIGEFRPFYFAPSNKEFYVADIEIILSQPVINQRVTLRGYSLKNSLSEKSRLLILTNLEAEGTALEDIISQYLNHWPNLEEAFQDFSRKIELLTYTGASHGIFSEKDLAFDLDSGTEIENSLLKYLELLWLYFKGRFLPPLANNADSAVLKEEFLCLKTSVKEEKDILKISFLPQEGFRFLKELEYACRRLNEREIVSADKKRLWFLV
jgi:hypothetical protein